MPTLSQALEQKNAFFLSIRLTIGQNPSYCKTMKDTNKLITEAIDHLMLTSYATQRRQNPQIKPENWALVYGEKQQKTLEKAYQALTIAQK